MSGIVSTYLTWSLSIVNVKWYPYLVSDIPTRQRHVTSGHVGKRRKGQVSGSPELNGDSEWYNITMVVTIYPL